MFLLIALVGILSMLLVVTASVAYLALPRGRLCPQCGGMTNPVVLRRLLRLLSPWVQWRWCSRCSWEGPGRRGPDLGPLDPPVGHDSGFRWGLPDPDNVPIFYWRSDTPSREGKDRPHHPSGFKWQSAKKPKDPAESDQPGFDLGRPAEGGPTRSSWDPKMGLPPRSKRPDKSPRPWYLSWLVSKDPPGFQWKERED